MFIRIQFTLVIHIALCSACLAQRHDTHLPAVRFVTVEKNVRLEVLDWGGTGKPVVLLAGGGNTAHVFDDFAPKLKKHFHVYGITRRGFGASQFSPIENGDRLARDILDVLDSLKIQKPILAGHSFAGAELSAIARISPGSVSGLVYLEAGYPYAFNNGKSPSMADFSNAGGAPQPSPQEKDLTSFDQLQQWQMTTYGFQLPKTEFQQLWDSTADGKPVRRRDFPGFAVFPVVLNNSQIIDRIPVASLVIFAIPHAKEAWTINSPDTAVRKESQKFFLKIDSLSVKQASEFEKSVPEARLLKLPGMHYIFISNETEVIKAVISFTKGLY